MTIVYEPSFTNNYQSFSCLFGGPEDLTHAQVEERGRVQLRGLKRFSTSDLGNYEGYRVRHKFSSWETFPYPDRKEIAVEEITKIIRGLIK